MELVSPAADYKESFIAAVKEYQAINSSGRRDIYELNVAELERDFPAYVAKLIGESKGEGLPEGWVSQTTYWLVDSNEFIGRASIRHELTDHLRKEGGHIGYDVRPSKRKMGYGKVLLGLALAKAKELGIDNILITCDVDNTGSKKIIEANGGVAENSVQLHPNKPAKLRYWISLKVTSHKV